MYPDGQNGSAAGRPNGGLWVTPTSETAEKRGIPRAFVVEPQPAVRAVLEYLLVREGYAVETVAAVEAGLVTPGPALLVLSDDDGRGLHVFESHDATKDLGRGTLRDREPTGILAYVPKPFGVADVLRVVRAVRRFDGRRSERPRTV